MKILIIVDPQMDFLDNGNLPVAGSFDKMCALSAHLGQIPYDTYDHIIVTLDWHPANHMSFKQNGGQWPTHCVQFTPGALPFSPISYHLLEWQNQNKVTYLCKGTDVNVEEYSAFDMGERINKNTAELFKLCDTDAEIDVAGIVGTVCVQNTIKSLKEHGFKNITALTKYIAQFSKESEAAFVEWCLNNEICVC